MHLNDFAFELPAALIAKFPTEKRSGSRLLCVDQQSAPSHHTFQHVLKLAKPGDLFIFNDTKVIPARLIGKKASGGKVELLLERLLDDKRILAQLRCSKAPKVGDSLFFENHQFEVVGREQQFFELALQSPSQSALETFLACGEMPLPPYLHRPATNADKERYQTVYAKFDGSVAAPTAGLHFDQDMIEALKQRQVEIAFLTLHIGAGTFSPIRTENILAHKMHSECFSISKDLCNQITRAKVSGRRIIAVGTTTLRALESASQNGTIKPHRGETDIFIYPGYEFKCVDVLITNFHLPASTLLMLVCAFGGYETIMSAYQEAVAHAYRFYSYGDAMWVVKQLPKVHNLMTHF